jgi:hypothetical protein
MELSSKEPGFPIANATRRLNEKRTRLENGAAGRKPCRHGLKQFAWRP